MVQIGLVMQVVFLLLVDWGSIVGILRQPELPWMHVVGLVLVNALLIPAAWLAWRWLPRSPKPHRT